MSQVEEVKGYYDRVESRWGYRLVLGGRKHFGYYPARSRGTSFQTALMNMEKRLGDGLGLAPGASVLDAGAGEGLVAIALANGYGLNVVGVDLIARNVVTANNNAMRMAMRSSVCFEQESYEQLPFPDASFDGVYTMETLVHAGDAATALREFRRVLKPGGRLMLFEYTMPALSDLEPEIQRDFTEVIEGSAMACFPNFVNGEFGALVEGCGFDTVQVEDATDRIMPMLRRFARAALVPYWAATLFRVRRRFVNATAAVVWYRNRDVWRYVILSAKKA